MSSSKHEKKDKRSPEELLRAIEEQSLDDALEDMEAMSSEDLAKLIASEGGDPVAIAARGKAQVEKLMDQRTRLAWHKAAQARIDKVRALAAAAPAQEKLPRGELLARIEAARRHPKLAQPIAVAFRKRTANESSDDELAKLLGEIELLRKMVDDES